MPSVLLEYSQGSAERIRSSMRTIGNILSVLSTRDENSIPIVAVCLVELIDLDIELKYQIQRSRYRLDRI